MLPNAPPVSNQTLREYQRAIHQHNDALINDMPKVEMHSILNINTRLPCKTLSELKSTYRLLNDLDAGGVDGGMERFFDLYYGGFNVLRDEDDFYRLAMNYFQKAASMNIRYCEPFFDPQGHTRRGIAFEAMIRGFQRAQVEAAQILGSAMEHYQQALPYRYTIFGIGLDSLKVDLPPLLFEEVFRRARSDGFKITCHCDIGGGGGADRIDHGLHAVDDPLLLQKVQERDLGMTICPWGYLCYSGEAEIISRVRTLYNAGIKMTIGSDDPSYMEDIWLNNSLYLLRKVGDFTNYDFLQLQKNAIQMCWAPAKIKAAILEELQHFWARWETQRPST
ncbi:adenosine deaminase [Aspergillus pseudoustus]|uniref:Adenosine deaminase n=1 Tax=Aspergillus pseudoustus TaxID=1810923 RepID=A0ABR4IZF9_9EURO